MQFVIKPTQSITLYGRNFPIRGNCVMELTSGEVYLCLSKGASVALIKPNGVKVPLTLRNYQEEINNYSKGIVTKVSSSPKVVAKAPNLNLNSKEKVVTKKIENKEEKQIMEKLKEINLTAEKAKVIDMVPIPTHVESSESVKAEVVDVISEDDEIDEEELTPLTPEQIEGTKKGINEIIKNSFIEQEENDSDDKSEVSEINGITVNDISPKRKRRKNKKMN